MSEGNAYLREVMAQQQVSGKPVWEIVADLQSRLTAAEARIVELEAERANCWRIGLTDMTVIPACNCLHEVTAYPTCSENPHKETCNTRRIFEASNDLACIGLKVAASLDKECKNLSAELDKLKGKT